MGLLKMELSTYQSSGAYNNDFANVVSQAQRYITNAVNENNHAKTPLKLAIVLDIDDTSISSYNFLSAANFCLTIDQFNADISKANDPVLAPMLSLYKSATAQNVAVFFVTGRGVELNKPTVNNLKAAGYTGWAGLYFRPKSDTQPSVIPYKTQARAAITQAGYTIIASIGDQQSDITGDNLGKGFKVPNPFYYIP